MKFFLFFCFILLFNTLLFSAEWSFQIDKKGRHEATVELDPYYSNVCYIYSLTDKPIPKEILHDEIDVYLHMLKNFYLPRYLLFEVSVNPFPIAGVYIKKNEREFYDDSRVFDNFNIIKAVTSGFPEPGAFSIFLGNVKNFVRKEELSNNDLADIGDNSKGQDIIYDKDISNPGDGKKRDEYKIVGKGFSGFLLSFGHWHIVDNIMVDDNWFESEIKLKGDDLREIHKMSWSYALGLKFHDNKEIKNALYLSIKRSRTDYKDEDINWLWKFISRNSEQELRIDFDIHELTRGTIVRYLFLLGKKFSFGNKVTLSLSIGAIKNFASGYSGTLEDVIDERWNIIARPNLSFNF